MQDPETFLKSLFEAAVTAADPAKCLPPHLKRILADPPKGRTVVLGAGKAGGAMARAVENYWQANCPERPLEGLVVTRYEHGIACDRIEVIEAAHPVPDAAGRDAAGRILDLAKSLGPDDLALCLMSGGGSALLSLPADDVSFDDKRVLTDDLLRSGATIHEMNCVRKHLSAIKGGRLAAAIAPARLVALAISDVPGDELDVIASGPTVPDPTTYADASALLAKYAITPPDSIANRLESAIEETPKPGDPVFERAETVLVARPQASLEAAAMVARAAGITPVILGDAIEGEAREVATVMAGIAQQAARHGQPSPAPCVLLSGGETTVTVRGNGRGGRNAEFLLAFAVAIAERAHDCRDRISAIACDTDGIDGTEDNAGALYLPDSLDRADANGLSPATFLADNDGYSFFQALDDLIITGPTLTNVNDFRAVLVV
ncbi:MAG: glycerate kinase [Rhodospirillaceae bacterium]|nr:glycerate kinase [Rhodospirillaceae bacterium]